MPQQLPGSLDAVEVVVRDLVAAAVREGTNVLCEGRLPGEGHHSKDGCHDQARP